MLLRYESQYLSIEDFSTVEFPDFVVLTGVNGSGKSHLIQAIVNKNVAIDGIENDNIVAFNYEDFKLDTEPSFNAHQLASERESAWQYHEQNIKPQAVSWRAELGDSYSEIAETCRNRKKSFWATRNEKLQGYRRKAKNYFSGRKIKDNQQATGILSLAKKIPYSIDEIEHDDFVSLYKPYVFKKNFLPNQLGKIFWDYYIKFRRNQVNDFENEKYGKNYDAVTEEEFITLHGPKPWDLVNEILTTFDTLDYRVSSPEGSDQFGDYQLKLIHTVKPNLEIDFDHLSSGERVLMALVASVYKSSADLHFPDLLLMDEVDASLHPSMMKNMLEVIGNIFLKQGVKVILVTHSPTTIALAPEDSIFVMNKSGQNRIEKKSKSEALEILTQGFATIEQGIKLFDEVARSGVVIITEGYNTSVISKALELNGISDVEVLSGIEGASGKNQLKTIYQFISKTNHQSKVLFVWDCDVNHSLGEENNTFPYSISHNSSNTLAKKGIENAFPETLFSNFIKTTTLSDGTTISQFDEHRKRDFEEFISARNDPVDFAHFAPFIAEVNRIRDIQA